MWAKPKQIPASVRSKVERFVSSHAFLALTGDVANTIKHHGSRSGGRYARVGEILSGPKATFHCVSQDGSIVRHDVLEVARAAMLEWRLFLLDNGLM